MKTRGVPPTVQEVIDVIGEAQALELMQRFARQRITIPVDPPCVHPFLDVLTPEQFIELCFRCGGWQWTIPAGEHLALQLRNRELAQLRQQGAKIADLVARYKITEARIFQILQEYK